jgi:hypothetical protein
MYFSLVSYERQICPFLVNEEYRPTVFEKAEKEGKKGSKNNFIETAIINLLLWKC